MNQRCFRLVFSHVRRQWIAVGEHVRRGRTPGASRSARRRGACGREGASAIVTATVTAGYRQRTVATLLAFTVLGFSAQTHAQIVAAPGPHAPGVSVTPNGLPLVNITAPTAGGVSHNQYQQFDVPTQGAILNNARSIVQTQTGGWVPGNPNLTGDPARIILNQVTSALPSNLAGYLEVAGSRAEVIVSNPNGITCNGCGFINTSRGVLTTGIPVFGGSGSLEAFRVTEGAIRVTGNGLNAGNLTHAALLARAIEVNAAIHAPTLDVVTGRNEIDATTFDVRSTEATASDAPAFALDVSRLGGMYAGKIRLIGTEAGVGVNIDGDISANGGTLTLTSAGELRIDGKVHAGEVLDATAADTIRIGGDVLANDALNVRTTRDLISTGQLRGGRDVKLLIGGTWQHDGIASAARHWQVDAGDVVSSGTIAAGANPDGTPGPTSDITLSVARSLRATGTHATTGNIRFTANAIDLSSASTTTPQNLFLHALGGPLTLAGTTTRVGGTSNLSSFGTMNHDGASLTTQHLSVATAGLSNHRGSISQWGTSSTKLALLGALDNRNGQITANGDDLSVTSTALDNASGKIEHAGAGVLRLSTGRFDNTDGTLATNGTMRVSADSWRNDRGTVSAKHALYLLTHGLLSNQVGLIQSGGLFSLDAGALHNDGGRLLALSDAGMRINVSRELLNTSQTDTQGEIAGKGDVVMTAGNAVNSGRWASDGTFRFETAGSLLNTGGQILARQHVVLAVGDVLDNSGGKLDTDGHLDTSADTIRNVRGQMSSARLTMNAARLDNDAGEIVQSDPQGDAPARLNITETLSNRTGAIKLAARDARIETRTFDNTNGTVAHAGDGKLSILATAIESRSGQIGTNGDLKLTAESLSNNHGRITALRTLSADAETFIENASGVFAGESVSLTAQTTLGNAQGAIESADNLQVFARELDNDGGAMRNSGHGQTRIVAVDAIRNRNGAQIAANADVALTTGTLDNTGGAIRTGKSLALEAAADLINEDGELRAAEALDATIGGAFVNRSGRTVAQDSMRLMVTEGVDNTDGRIETAGSTAQLSLSASGLTNDNGAIVNVGNQALDVAVSGHLLNRASARIEGTDVGGFIAGNGAVNVSANRIENLDGARLEAGQSLAVASGTDFVNRQGHVRTNGRLSLTTNDDLDNTDGEIHAGGAMQVNGRNAVNRQGSIRTNDTLSLTARSNVDNADGEIFSTGTMHVRAGGDIQNVRGSIEVAGKRPSEMASDEALSHQGNDATGISSESVPTTSDEAITVAAATLDNTDGRIVNATRGELTLTADVVRNHATLPATTSRPTGFIAGNGDVSLLARTLANGPGANVSAGNDLRLGMGDRVENAGTLFAGQDLHLAGQNGTSTATLDNLGQLQARRDATLLAAGINHTGGEIAVNRDLTLTATHLIGTGQLRAGNNLHVTLPGDFTYSPAHLWRANSDLNLTIGGLLTITGELEAVQQLTIHAAQLRNQDGGRIRGKAVYANATDRIDNETRIDGDEVWLRTPTFVNTGAVIGGRIRFDGTHLTNAGAQAVMAATQQLDVFAQGQVLNESGATLYSLNGLRIGAADTRDADGFLARQSAGLTNRSATIEAGGDIDVAVKTFVNERGQVTIERGVDAGTTTVVRHIWIAGYLTFPGASEFEQCQAVSGAPCERLPTTHWSHSLQIDGGPAMVNEVIYKLNDHGQPSYDIKEVNKVPNPANIPFTQWQWGREARAELSAEKLYVAGTPITVTLPKGHLTTLDTGKKTFSLVNPIIEVYKGSGFDVNFSSRNITKRSTQHFESIQDDGKGNWIIGFWPDYDPAEHLRPTYVDEGRNSVITGAPDEGVRIFRYGHGIEDGRDTNEYRRDITTHSTVDRIIHASAPGTLTSQGSFRLNVDGGSAINHASSISAGGNIGIRGNGGQITNRSLGLERIDRTRQTSHLYWHEKSGNSDFWFPQVELGATEHRSIVGGLDALISSNQSTRINARDIVIDTASTDGRLIDARWVDSQIATNFPDVGQPRIVIDGNDSSHASVSTTSQSAIDAPQHERTSTGVSGAIQTLDAVSGGIPDLTLPRSGLFSIVTSPSQPYLVVTDARFTDYGTFVSSNYMLDLLNIDPAGIERRIGDGFYEAKLVREQILRLTGRARLRGYDSNDAASATDADAEYRALLTQGARAGRDLTLRVGIRLTEDQMQALTDDIVWLVRQDVTLPDGTTQTVLVPTLYLAHGKRVSLHPGGALVTGRDVLVQASQQVSNRGRIVGDSSTQIRAVDIENHGVIGRRGTQGNGSTAGVDGATGGKVEVIASRDVLNIGGDITGKQVHVEAGRDVVVTSRTRSIDWESRGGSGRSTTLESGGRIDAQDSLNVIAGRDLSVTGAQIQAGGDASLVAGRDVSVGAIELERRFGDGSRSGDNRSLTKITEHAASVIGVGGDTAIAAGRDVVAEGAKVTTGGNLIIAAGRDVEITAVTDKLDFTGRVRNDDYAANADTHMETVRGGEIRAGGDIGMGAGQVEAIQRVLDERGVRAYVTDDESRKGNATILGSYVSAGDRDVSAGRGSRTGTGTGVGVAGATEDKVSAAQKGTVQIVATGDVTIGGVTTEQDDVRWSRDTKRGLLSTTTEERLRELHATQTIGSTVSGDTVTIASGQDVAIAGSNVVADGDVNISAKRDVTITSAEDRQRSVNTSEITTSGVFGSGTSLTIGQRSEKDKQRRESTSQTGSVVGSVSGDMSVRAGNDYRQEGSKVIAGKGDIDIEAQRVAIIESAETDASVRETEVRQAGVTIAISSPVLAAAETVGQMGKAVGKVDDGRMKALGVVAGALAVKNAADSIKNLSDAANVSISVTVGGSLQQSRETTESTTSVGSTVSAGGNASVSATGDGEGSSLIVRGSDITATHDIALKADGDIDIQASTNTFEQHRKSSGVSGGIGVGISVGSKGAAFGVTANASASRGKADGRDVTQKYSHVTAGGEANVASGGDTNIRGGVIAGERVVADVGGDLNIESLQDTSVYQSKDQSISASGTVGIGGASGSINVSHQQINSDFASVGEQAGIKAGDKGFDVTVGGNTDLVGAVIASTDKAAEAGRNRLKTGSLTERDIENHAEFDAFGVSLGGGFATGGGDSAKVGTDQKGKAETGANATPGSELPKTGSISVAPPMVAGASGSERSVTRSGISAGVIEITDDAAQREKTGKTAEEAVASVNRDVSSDKDGANALTNKFDKEQIETGFEIMHAVQRELGSFLNNRVKDYAALKQAREAEKDPTKFAELDRKLEDAKRWAPGGTYRQIATVISAAASGNVSAGMGEFVQRAAVGYLQTLGVEKVKQIADGLNSETARAALQGIVGCAGAAASGGNCSAGALGASASVVLNNLLDHAGNTPEIDRSADEKEARENLVTSIVAGIAAASGSGIDTTSTASSARIEIENNYLSEKEARQLDKEISACKASQGDCLDVVEKYLAINNERSKELVDACTGGGVACVTWEELIIANANVALDTDGIQIRSSKKLKDKDATDIVNYLNSVDIKFLQDNITKTDRFIDVATDPVTWISLGLGARAIIQGVAGKELLIAAGTSGAVNAAIQYGTTGDVKLSDLIGSAVIASITGGKSYNPTVIWNAIGGYYSAKINGDDPFMAGIVSSVGASGGYATGSILKIPTEKIFNPISKSYELIPTGIFTITKPIPRSNIPSITGNIGDSALSGAFSTSINNTKDDK